MKRHGSLLSHLARAIQEWADEQCEPEPEAEALRANLRQLIIKERELVPPPDIGGPLDYTCGFSQGHLCALSGLAAKLDLELPPYR